MTDQEVAQKLWPLIQPPPGTKLLWFAKWNRPVGKPELRGGSLYDANGLSLAMSKLREMKADAYIQLNPVAYNFSGKRASIEDVTHYRTLVLDIDPVPDMPTSFFLLNREKVRPLLGIMPLQIATGRGWQYWYPVDHPLELNNEIAREHAAYMNGKVMSAVTVDSSNGSWKLDYLPDITRLARMPNTINSKTGRRARWHLPDVDYGPLLDGKALALWAGPLPPKPAPAPSRFHWQDALSHLSKTAKTFIMEGVDSKNPESKGRHSATVAAARSLRDANIPYEGALTATLRGAQLCRPPVDADPSYTSVEVVRIVADAYGIR